MEIRDAVESDFEEITAIYNEVLTHSTAIYNDKLTTVEVRLAWWRARQQQGFPVLVATEGAVLRDLRRSGIFAPGLAIDLRLKEPSTFTLLREGMASARRCWRN